MSFKDQASSVLLPPTRYHLLIACSFSFELIHGFTRR